MTSKLALLGGEKAIPYEMPAYQSIGKEERQAVDEVMAGGVLSKFLGAWHEDYFGGPKVKEFEKDWAKFFGATHAVSVNSCTSGLMCALGAIGIEPGDEVIVSPWTMSATATAILVWNAIPVFVDIEAKTFGLDPKSIEKKITPRTKAIVVTDIFGQAADLEAILQLAKQHGLKVIEDAAQAPGAKAYDGRYVGTLADVGVYSLNYHKHIHTGEGGVCVTQDSILADRMQMIRNHGEAVALKKETSDFTNLIGFNFRMGEIEAAIGIEQLKKLPALAQSRSSAGNQLTKALQGLKGITLPFLREGCSHVYYVYPIILDLTILGKSRQKIAAALRAEGIPGVAEGYQNIHLLPMYQKRIAYGKKGFPWNMQGMVSDVSYAKGICPVAEKLHDDTMLGLALCTSRFNSEDMNLVAEAFKKVWANLEQL